MRAFASFTAAVVATVGTALVGVPVLPQPAAAEPAAGSCASLEDPVYRRTAPHTAASMLALYPDLRARKAVARGFTGNVGRVFGASRSEQPGTIGIHWLTNRATGDHRWEGRTEAVRRAMAAGYRDRGVAFYASPGSGDACVPVYRFVKRGFTRYSTRDGEAALVAHGWTRTAVAFHASPKGSSPATVFTIAVLPDTQRETHGNDPRFADRTTWLVDHRQDLDLRFVLHTGDVTDWGWLDPVQYTLASDAMAVLEQAGIPYAITAGNHDTRAVGWDGVEGSTGYGGAPYAKNPECASRFGADQCVAKLLLRHTEEFNAVFPPSRFPDIRGVYQAGRVDNSFTAFSAGGKEWLVLTLEFAPRTEVVAWAAHVIASHPHDNVVLQTHYYLGPGSGISKSPGYGDHAGRYLYDHLVRPYSNVKLVFSGHTGTAGYRQDVRKDGTKVASYLQNTLSDGGNGVRLVQIDTATGEVTTRIYEPNKDRTVEEFSTDTTGMRFVD